jgi:fucose 4-O-acetylase-like acetyltransferase
MPEIPVLLAASTPAADGAEPAGPAATASRGSTVDALVDATPAGRDRVVDLLRAVSIATVVLWHWVFSVTHVDGRGALTMPNPIDSVPGLWLGTWVLQIMPVFFVVGGYANLAGWQGVTAAGGGWVEFARRRTSRLLRPIASFALVWLVADIAIRLLRPGTPSVWAWGRVVFVPLWFLGAYLAVVLLAPLTARLHRWSALGSVAVLGAAVALVDAARFGLGWGTVGYANSLLVWLFAHQLGYLWRDGHVDRWGIRRRLAVTGTGLAGLVLLTATHRYPSSMVAVRGQDTSNMFPTTACIAVLAVFQFGLVLLARPALQRLLARRAAWKATVAVNAVAMTVFTWHMTALVAAIGVWRALGHHLGAEPTAAWWAQRPVWLVLPGLALAVLVAAFARFELPTLARPVAAGPDDPATGTIGHR